ncbi:hypothetical protein IA539_18610 [Gordonia sp. zg691]|uniref:YrhK domain-containing protein n=1 Tax=Gordonia jinghuaiqii TaxID=2758710 RepID=A0A7D7LW72_9ACTN|nr:hypothetical protein [Gordonia jinghuaiqii]MBD0863191.1 hypothetical protein [Gordonia jinghuaiqii]MCR5980297.1 hypothetical protein [Gordonia jinghuaiqii]QMT01955.1 hypothetical protein H1R19_01810 [Gordonia jinghuaiqii]
MTVAVPASPSRSTILTPTLQKQCWGFMIGSSLFALGSAPGFGSLAGPATVNLCFFIGAWFFTAAGLIQLLLSGPVTTRVDYGSGVMVRADWLSAATQSLGTVLFNVSTTAALTAHSIPAERDLVWSPDAGGSIAFLVSGFLAVLGYKHARQLVDPGSRTWWAAVVNLLGCIAFGISAVGAYITAAGVTVDTAIANVGTFAGALCFLLAAFLLLPRWDRSNPEIVA